MNFKIFLIKNVLPIIPITIRELIRILKRQTDPAKRIYYWLEDESTFITGLKGHFRPICAKELRETSWQWESSTTTARICMSSDDKGGHLKGEEKNGFLDVSKITRLSEKQSLFFQTNCFHRTSYSCLGYVSLDCYRRIILCVLTKLNIIVTKNLLSVKDDYN